MRAEPSQLRILVVDDDQDSCDILSQLLRHLGYTPICVSDSTEALPHLLRNRFDVVLLDLVMPGLSGFDLLRALQTSLNESKMPVVAVSAHTEFRHKAREVGFHAFIDKPVELAKLRPLMSQLLPAS